jgi:hypothetical protein
LKTTSSSASKSIATTAEPKLKPPRESGGGNADRLLAKPAAQLLEKKAQAKSQRRQRQQHERQDNKRQEVKPAGAKGLALSPAPSASSSSSARTARAAGAKGEKGEKGAKRTVDAARSMTESKSTTRINANATTKHETNCYNNAPYAPGGAIVAAASPPPPPPPAPPPPLLSPSSLELW